MNRPSFARSNADVNLTTPSQTAMRTQTFFRNRLCASQMAKYLSLWQQSFTAHKSSKSNCEKICNKQSSFSDSIVDVWFCATTNSFLAVFSDDSGADWCVDWLSPSVDFPATVRAAATRAELAVREHNAFDDIFTLCQNRQQSTWSSLSYLCLTVVLMFQNDCEEFPMRLL